MYDRRKSYKFHEEGNEDGSKRDYVKFKFLSNNKFIFTVVGFFLGSFIPYYGYLYLRGYLDYLGFTTSIPVSAWEGGYYFLISFSDAFEYASYITDNLFLLLVCFFVILLLYNFLENIFISFFRDYLNLHKKGVDLFKNKKINRFFNLTVNSFFQGNSAAIAVAFSIVVISIFYYGAILGAIHGVSEGKKSAVENRCIYAHPDSECSVIYSEEGKLKGYSPYSNDRQLFLLTNNGRYYLNNKGNVLEFKPYTLSLAKYAKENKRFDSKEWKLNVNVRWSMLESFIESEDRNWHYKSIEKLLGEPDGDIFHYSEFPVYKLSESTDCRIAFPYDWKTEVAVNTVLLGDCSALK